MRVAIACDWFLKYAGAKARAMRAAGADVLLCCRDHAFEFGGHEQERRQLLAELRSSGVVVVELPGKVSDLRHAPVVLRRLCQVLAWRPDVLDLQENHDPRLTLLASLLPTVLTVHDPVPHPGEAPKGHHGPFRELSHRFANAYVVHGEALRDELALPRTARRRRVYTLPHGTDTISADSLASQPPPASPRVLFFGRLELYKGLEVLLRAMSLVWARDPLVRLIVAGHGPQAALVSEGDPRIETHLEYVPERLLNTLIDGATVVVLPYLQASASGVGTKAIARGVPVIVSAVGTLPALAVDPSYIVPAGDDRRLAETILAHLGDGAAQRLRILRHAEDNYSWRVVADRALAQFREVALS